MSRLIDADELIHELAKCKDVQLNAEGDAYYIRQSEVFRTVNDAPTIEERKKGKWIEQRDTRFGPKLNYIIICSNCNIAFSGEDMIRRSFCPNCGADMRG